MKNLKKTKKLYLVVIITVLINLPIGVYAFENVPEQTTSTENIGIATRKEETGYIYMTTGNKTYKRLWSYTYGRWIDKDWIFVS